MTKRLKLSPDGVNNVIDIIMSDEKLIGYVRALVSKRLTKEMRDDPDWCNQVVDLSIEQVLEDVDIVQLINNICGTSSLKIKNGSKNNKKERKVSKSVESELITPPFSATEPHAVANTSPRRVVKEMNKKKSVDLPPTSGSNTQFLKKALTHKLELDRSASVESNASTVPVVDSFNDGVIISTQPHGQKREVEWPTMRSERSESSISSEHENSLYVSVLDSEAQASFREDPNEEPNEDPSHLSDADSLEDTPPRGSKQAHTRNELGMTQTVKLEVTLGGKGGKQQNSQHVVSDRPGQKTYKVPYKPTTFDGKPMSEKDAPAATTTNTTANSATTTTAPTTTTPSTTVATTPGVPSPTTTTPITAPSITTSTTTSTTSSKSPSPLPSTPQTASSVVATPLTHTNSVHDEDFLSSWEKQVLQGMKNGEESDGEGEDNGTNTGEEEEEEEENDDASLTPRASFENSFVDQLVRSPSKTLHEDLDQYELHSQDSPQSQQSQGSNNSKSDEGPAKKQVPTIDRTSGGVTPELRVVSPHTALQLLHAPEATPIPLQEDSWQEPEPVTKQRAQSAESDLTDPTEDSPRPHVMLHTHHHHKHHKHPHHGENVGDGEKGGGVGGGGDKEGGGVGGSKGEGGGSKGEGGDMDGGDEGSESGDSYSSDESDSDSDGDNDEDADSTDYLRAPPTQAAGQLLFFDQSRFDADADYFASEGAQKKKSPPKKTGPRAKRTDTDSPLRVRFAPRLIAEVHYRDRVGYHEKAELFFTHNEEYQFTMDQSKEAERAEALGMTWMEWMEQRTDEDVAREEAESDNLNDFKLYSGEYYEEDEHHSSGYNSLFSDTALHSTSIAPAGDHDFKAGNAHVSPVIAHHHVLTTAQVLASHGQNGSNGTSGSSSGGGKQGGAEGVFSDELSVPSCSSDDDEYDFDNF